MSIIEDVEACTSARADDVDRKENRPCDEAAHKARYSGYPNESKQQECVQRLRVKYMRIGYFEELWDPAEQSQRNCLGSLPKQRGTVSN